MTSPIANITKSGSEIIYNHLSSTSVGPFWRLEHHIEWVERNRQAELNDNSQKWTQALVGVKDETRQADIIDIYSSEMLWLEEDLTRIQWYSNFLLSWSQLEVTLHKICIFMAERLEIDPPSGKERKIVDSSKKWLRANTKANTPAIWGESEWKTLKAYNVIRNHIAHYQGQFERASFAFSEVSRLPGIEWEETFDNDPYASVKLTYDFLIEAVREMRTFVHLICRTAIP